MKFLTFLFLLNSLNLISQKLLTKIASDTNFLFTSNEYRCICQYDSTKKFSLSVEKSMVKINSKNYLKFVFKDSLTGIFDFICVRKIESQFKILDNIPDTIFEYTLFSFNETIDNFYDYPSYSIFGIGRVLKNPLSNKISESRFYYKLEGVDTESRHISVVYFDKNHNIICFEYYDGYDNFNCTEYSKKKKKNMH